MWLKVWFTVGLRIILSLDCNEKLFCRFYPCQQRYLSAALFVRKVSVRFKLQEILCPSSPLPSWASPNTVSRSPCSNNLINSASSCVLILHPQGWLESTTWIGISEEVYAVFRSGPATQLRDNAPSNANAFLRPRLRLIPIPSRTPHSGIALTTVKGGTGPAGWISVFLLGILQVSPFMDITIEVKGLTQAPGFVVV